MVNVMINSTGNEAGLLTETLEMQEVFYEGVRNQEVALYYQPKINPLTNELNGIEANIHWSNHRLLKKLLKYPFEHHLIRFVNQWTLIACVSQIKEWEESNELHVPISLKIYPAAIEYMDFYQELKQLIDDIGISPNFMDLEITFYGNHLTEEFIEFVNMLKTLEVSITLGNFGEGPSLQTLKFLPLDGVKLAPSLQDNLKESYSGKEIVTALVELARNFGLNIHVEGVRDDQDYQLLKEIGCHSLQGYYCSRPLTSKEMSKVLQNKPVRMSV